MKASRFLYMLGGSLITVGLLQGASDQRVLFLVVIGIIGTFVSVGLDKNGN